MKKLILPALLSASLLLPAAAQADVLVSPPTRSMTTSGCITMGVWYQSYSGGPRTVKVSVYYHGRRKMQRRITASTSWRYYTLYCPGYPNAGTYRTRVTGAGWSHASPTFPTRVVIDRD